MLLLGKPLVQEIMTYTLNSTYNKKKYVILLRYRWLFIKGDIFIGVCVYLGQTFSFVIGNFLLKVTSYRWELSVPSTLPIMKLPLMKNRL